MVALLNQQKRRESNRAAPRTGKPVARRDRAVTSGYRYYSPDTGRWVSRDPVGEGAFPLGMAMYQEWAEDIAQNDESIYVFIGNAFVTYTDYLGLYCGSGWTEWVVPDNPGGFPFGEPCRNHDNCYGNCRGGSRLQCDNQFLSDMMAVCARQPERTRGWCRDRRGRRRSCWRNPRRRCESWARRYYNAVRRWGGGPFRNARECCEENIEEGPIIIVL